MSQSGEYSNLLQQLIRQLTMPQQNATSTGNNTVLPSLGQVNIVACQSTASAIANASPRTVQSVTVPSQPTVTECVITNTATR